MGIDKEVFTDLYYNDIIKQTPAITERIKTTATIEYLLDCGVPNNEICRELFKHKKKALTGDDLSDSLWKDSIIKRGAFYLHHELRIISPAPVFDFLTNKVEVFPFFCEMKIRYTKRDLLDYFYKTLPPLERQLVNSAADLKAIDVLMKKYSAIDFVEPLDVVLFLIDKTTSSSRRIIDLDSQSHTIIRQLINSMKELEAADMRKTVWRWEAYV